MCNRDCGIFHANYILLLQAIVAHIFLAAYVIKNPCSCQFTHPSLNLAAPTNHHVCLQILSYKLYVYVIDIIANYDLCIDNAGFVLYWSTQFDAFRFIVFLCLLLCDAFRFVICSYTEEQRWLLLPEFCWSQLCTSDLYTFTCRKGG